MQTLTLSVLVTVGLIELGLSAWLIGCVRRQQELSRRVGTLADALSLLTETSEAGFRASAVEISRLAEHLAVRRVPAQRATTSRVARARGRGRTVEQIAADQRMSEGEVHLRLTLHEDDTAASATGPERRKATRRGAAPETSHA